MANGLLASDAKIVDLGADFRLKDRADWERKNRKTHKC
jgi:N-acetyl-gamma-glutamylphosphate reductase